MTSNPRAYTIVLDWLEEQLRQGSICIGDKLPSERVLADKFGISRTSVREAVRILDAMGLVRCSTGSGPNSGAVVISEASSALAWALRMHVLTESLPKHDIVQTRILIEADAARKAALAPDSPERTAKLEQAERLIEAMDAPHLPSNSYHLHDTQFHMLITSLAHNVVVDTIMESLREATISYVRESVSQRDDWDAIVAKLQEHHREILAAIQAHDPERAAEAVRVHILWFYQMVRSN